MERACYGTHQQREISPHRHGDGTHVRPWLYGGRCARDLHAGRGLQGQLLSLLFPSKQALVLAVIVTYGAHIRGLWEDVMTTDGSLRERLQRVFAHTYGVHSQLLTGSDQLYGCPLGNLALELGSQDRVVRQKLHARF